MQKVIMFCRNTTDAYAYPVEYQLQTYLNTHPNYSVSSMAFAKYELDFYRLLVVFDVKE